jgi:hypothetical protein
MIRARGILAAVLVALSVLASAQLPPGFKMPSLWYNPALLMDPGVQKELNVSSAVQSKIQQVMMQQAMKMLPVIMSMKGGNKSGKTPTEADVKKSMPLILDAYNKMQKACVDNLNAAQLARLHQITLQSFGPKSLLDPKVGAQVGLSPAQQHKLQLELGRLALSQQGATMGLLQGGQPNLSAAQSLAANSRKKTQALLDTVLTASQRAKWKALQGKPIQLSGMASLMGGG